ncbi:MAG: transglutaminase domain-containing protein [Oscillospiraceae bacterium]|nr:transglutaminase domain-containing protein [Oscillospiraceae bacterium]
MKKISLSAVLLVLALLTFGCENVKTSAQSDIQTASSTITKLEQSSSEKESLPSSSAAQSEREEQSSNLSTLPLSANSSSQKPAFSKPAAAPQKKPTLEELRHSNRKKAQEIIAKLVREDMTDVEKAKATYMWLYPNFKYRGVKVDLSNGYTEQLTEELAAYYFKYHKGSCEHYAAVQKILFEELGIESYYVVGERYSALSKRWGAHTWLMANINGNMYHVDGLFGGLFYDVKETTFMVPDSAIEHTHRWNKDTYVPCTQPQLLK